MPLPKDSKAGLYAMSREGNIVKVSIPQDCMAFQIGETMQIHTGGILKATPHQVRSGSMGAPGVSRNQYVLFMEPNFKEAMFVPHGRRSEQAIFVHENLQLPDLKQRWQEEISFEKFEMNTYASFAVHEEK